jgi:hypothetical protein
MAYPHFKPQAHTKQECFQAMLKKKEELLREIAFFDKGLLKIDGLKEGDFYELTYSREYPNPAYSHTIKMFVQCRAFGRDHVEFRLLACDMPENKFRESYSALIKATGNISFSWSWDWGTKLVEAKNAVLYVGWPWITKHYEKLVKGE